MRNLDNRCQYHRKHIYCELIIFRGLPIFMDFVDNIKPWNQNSTNICQYKCVYWSQQGNHKITYLRTMKYTNLNNFTIYNFRKFAGPFLMYTKEQKKVSPLLQINIILYHTKFFFFQKYNAKSVRYKLRRFRIPIKSDLKYHQLRKNTIWFNFDDSTVNAWHHYCSVAG